MKTLESEDEVKKSVKGGTNRRKWILRLDDVVIGFALGSYGNDEGTIATIGGPGKYVDAMLALLRDMPAGDDAQFSGISFKDRTPQRVVLRRIIRKLSVIDAVDMLLPLAIERGWDVESVDSFRRLIN